MSEWKDIRTKRPRLFDPYYDWSKATDFRYYGPSEWLPVLLELKDSTDAVAFSNQVSPLHGPSWGKLVRVSPLYQAKPRRLRAPSHFLSAFVRREFIELLYAGEGPSGQVESFCVGRGVAFEDRREATFEGAPPKLRLAPEAVVIGVIDDDIAFAHDRFRDAPTSTRIHYFWDQLQPLAPSPTFYGREIVKHDVGTVPGIDTRLATYRHGPLVEEDRLYRSYGYLDHSTIGHKAFARRAGHGTHVMDLAANPRANGIGPLIAVQLPAATTEDTAGGTLAPQVMDALWYMLHRADAIAAAGGLQHLPLVVNLSYGTLAGPHDTTGILERAIDELMQLANATFDRALRVVLPAGNSHSLRCHGSFALRAGQSQDLRWRVPPDHRAESFLEIWYPDDGALHITVASPAGVATVGFGAGVDYTWQPTLGVTAGLVSFYPALPPSKRQRIRISLAPTAWPDGALTLAPAGVWTVRVTNAGKQRLRDIDAWIERSDAAPGYPRHRRQSYFEDPEYRRVRNSPDLFEGDPQPPTAGAPYVTRAGTLNAIATGRMTTVVAGFRRNDWNPAGYSAAGPTIPPKRGNPYPDGPDVMAPSDDSPSHYGVLAAGTRSGSCFAMHGTSAAAPQITRWIAGDLMAGRQGRRQEVGNAPTAGVAPGDYNEANPPPGLSVPAIPVERRGGGRLDAASPRRRRFDR